MVVTFKFVGAFRSLAGKEKQTLRIGEAVLLREALRKIMEKEKLLKKALIDPELEDPRPNALILVNGKEISVLNGLDTVLTDGDEVVLIPVIHGG
ncbi:MAG: MoaD/ThiS family protein [Candidatus Bathyarchaeia archaeon]